MTLTTPSSASKSHRLMRCFENRDWLIAYTDGTWLGTLKTISADSRPNWVIAIKRGVMNVVWAILAYPKN
jgi:hypothetical protein